MRSGAKPDEWWEERESSNIQMPAPGWQVGGAVFAAGCTICLLMHPASAVPLQTPRFTSTLLSTGYI